MPRDVAPEVNNLDGVYLYDIDSLQSIARETLQARRQQIAAAEAIIDEHVADFARQIERLAGGDAYVPHSARSVPAALRTSEL